MHVASVMVPRCSIRTEADERCVSVTPAADGTTDLFNSVHHSEDPHTTLCKSKSANVD